MSGEDYSLRYRATPPVFTNYMKMFRLAVILSLGLCSLQRAASTPSIARDWDEQILSAIRIDTPHPPAQARNLFSLSVCMYDAWSAYPNGPVGYVYRAK